MEERLGASVSQRHAKGLLVDPGARTKAQGLKLPSRTRGHVEVYRGPPCPSGHNGLRYKSTGQCVECKRLSGRKGAQPRGSHSDAMRNQARWLASFEKNYAAVKQRGTERLLRRNSHGTPLQMWLYRMRTRWSGHPPERQARLLALGNRGWWLRSDPPRHQVRTGHLVGSPEHKAYKRALQSKWNEKNADWVRKRSRAYYATNPAQRAKAAEARRIRFKENPGEAAFRTSKRREREKAQRCKCCTNEELRRVYLRNGARGLETDHRLSLGIAIVLGRKGMHCVSNLQGLTPQQHRAKTSADIRKLGEICRRKGIPYHQTARAG